MRECITRAKELAEVVNESASKATKSPSIGSSGSHEIDLTTCKPVDVLLPYYSKLSVSSQKWVLFFSVM